MAIEQQSARPKARRDPVGLGVALLNRLAKSHAIDRLGLRKQTESRLGWCALSLGTADISVSRVRPGIRRAG